MDWTRIQELFDTASQLPKHEVQAYLDQACGQDTELRRTIEGLLAQSEPSSFVQGLVQQEAGGIAAPEDHTGERIGPYRIERELGRGGMGVVYLASRDDREYEKRVALKLVQFNLGRTYPGRLRQERQILAQLEHPNIVRLLDGGTTPNGLSYLAMDYVEGLCITDYCDAKGLSIRERCALLVQICDAVDYAHRLLIVHRDIKPANILVNADGIPKLLDFGIAKLLDAGDGEQTAAGYTPLTPDYASPEQLTGKGPVTTATDVYQLGAVLYRLLTGRKPGEAAAHPAPGEAGLIAHKAMHTDASQRYASARDLGDDLRRLLDGRPVQARGDSALYTLRKWVARSPVAAAVTAMLVVSVVAGVASTIYQARRAERRFEQVRALAGTFVFEFDDQIKDLVGSTPARAFVVQTAIRYFESLQGEAAGDRSLQAELAEAYLNVGLIQAAPAMASLGKTGDALASFQKAESLARGLLASQPQHQVALRVLGLVLAQRQAIMTSTRRDNPAARPLGEEAQQVASRLILSPKLAAADYKALCIVYKNHADFLLSAGETKTPLPLYEKSVAAMEQGWKLSGKEEFRLSQTGPLVGIARLQRDLGNPREWARRLEALVQIIQPTPGAVPKTEFRRRQLFIVLTGIAQAYGDTAHFHLNQPAKSLELLARAEELADAPGLAAYEAAWEHANVAAIRSRLTGQESKSVQAAIESAEKYLATMYGLDPQNILAANLHLFVNWGRARLQLREGRDIANAVATLRKEYEKVEARLARNPDDVAALDSAQVTGSLLGSAYIAAQRWDDAGAVLAKTTVLATQTLRKYPEDLYFIRDHAWLLETRGDLHLARGATSRAMEDYRLAEAEWVRWRQVAQTPSYADLCLAGLRAKIANPSAADLRIPAPQRY